MSIHQQISKAFDEWAKDHLRQWQLDAYTKLQKGQDRDSVVTEAVEAAKKEDPEGNSAAGQSSPSLTGAASLPGASPVLLKEITGITDIAAVKAGQTLTFAPQLTLLYGENGSGKSSFSRILKSACRCPQNARESVIPHAFDSGPDPKPSATIVWDEGGTEKSHQWTPDTAGPIELQRVAVFDSKCIHAFLGKNNELNIAPGIFGDLANLARITKTVKEEIQKQADAAEPPAEFLRRIGDELTPTGKAVAALDADSEEKAIRKLGVWAKEDDDALAAKEKELAKLRSESVEERRKRLTSEKRLVEQVEGFLIGTVKKVTPDAVQAAKVVWDDYQVKAEASKIAAKLIRGDAELGGVGTPTWKKLLEAAAEYSKGEAYPGQDFPVQGEEARCVLCQQPLEEPYGERLANYWSFLGDQTAKSAEAAMDKIKGLEAGLRTIEGEVPSHISDALSDLEEKLPGVTEAVSELLAAVKTRREALARLLRADKWIDDMEALDEAVIQRLKQRVTELEAAIRACVADPEATKQVSKVDGDLKELLARKRLYENLEEVVKHVAKKRMAKQLRELAASINTSGLSRKVKGLYDEHVTDQFRKAVKDQMKALGCRSVRAQVEPSVAEGRIRHQMALEDAALAVDVENVLSEGERTAVSLAWFLSDLGTANETSCAVFDDPVTSLDHRIQSGVAEAIIREAAGRQVIVFTHDLPFFCDLVESAARAGITPQTILVEAFTSTSGNIDPGLPNEIRKVKERMPELERLMKEVKQADHDGDRQKLEQSAYRFFGLARSTWERSVEDVLFRQVVRRFRRDIQTMRLTEISIDDTTITRVFKGMTTCSERIDAHDQSVGTKLPAVTPDDLQEMYDELRGFIAEHEKKSSEAKKRLEHLKARAY